MLTEREGVVLGQKIIPLDRVGLLGSPGDGKLSLYGADGLYSCKDSRGQGRFAW